MPTDPLGACSSGASYLEQLQVLFIHSTRTRRLEALGFQRFLQCVAPSIVGALLWWRRGRDTTLAGAADTGSLIFFEMV